jgi:cystathionine beta-lyase/cystathionine gamma-synthase
MSAGVPGPPSRAEAIDAAAESVRDARTTDRDAILEAQRVLRHAEKAHDQAVRDAAKRLHQDNTDADAAQQELAAARADRRWMAEARPLLDRVVGRLDGDEDVLDMVAGIAAGHDGVMLLTSRRVLFVAPRRTLDVPYEQIEAVSNRGRHFGARVTIVARDTKIVIGGLRPVRAAEIAELLNEQIDQHALR